ncbi:lysosomal thioesterase PPT2 precursor [Silurus meridionalis]|nr:lysosomal thioesterase PPT2 precursor [Silurus meridionalis]
MRRRCVREECVWSSVLVCVSVLLCGSVCVFGYKPVIIIHGLFDTPADFINLQRYINQSHPGTNVTVIDLFDRSESLEPLWKQVEGFKEAIYPIMHNSADGVHLLCYSQGGLICRGILSTLKDHNVHSFISLSSPQAGQYGDVQIKIDKQINRWHNISLFLLSDPHHRDMYLNTSNYLALLNNEKPHPDSTVWKQNFLRIGKLVLIGGPDDGVIMPWQSSQFGFYDDNETVVEMKDQEVFLRDSFGLKSLYARGDLELCSVAGVEHVYWHSNETVYKRCIEKWLT